MAEEIGDGTLGTPIPGDGAGPSRPSRRPNATILRTLTFTQNVSAAVFSVFIPMHLASPIAAAFGGIGAADQVLVCRISLTAVRPHTNTRSSLHENTTSQLNLWQSTLRSVYTSPHHSQSDYIQHTTLVAHLPKPFIYHQATSSFPS